MASLEDTGHFRVSADVPFGLGAAAVIDHSPAAARNGRAPLRVVDVTLFTLPIPDFTTITPVYFATPALALALTGTTGLTERSYTLSRDDQLEGLGEFEGKDVPELRCFDVTGTFGQTDFAHVEGVAGLIASARAVDILRCFDLGIGTIEEYRR